MNVHESEKIAGILSSMGYVSTENMEQADIIVFNTCCIRENAENHAYGNIGMLKKLKANKKEEFIYEIYKSFNFISWLINELNRLFHSYRW